MMQLYMDGCTQGGLSLSYRSHRLRGSHLNSKKEKRWRDVLMWMFETACDGLAMRVLHDRI